MSEGRKSYGLEEGDKVRDGRVEGSLAIEGEGQAAISLTPDTDNTESASLLDLSLFTLRKMTQ